MKDFFRMILIESFEDKDWVSYCLGVIMWFFVLIISGFIVCCFCNGINRIGQQEQNGIGIVTEKCFVPAHSEVYGKGQLRWVDDAYNLQLTKDNLSDYICVSHHYYNHTEVGNKICMIYYTGRLWKSLYIVSFCGEKNNY